MLADTGAQNQAESTVRLVVTHSNLAANFMDIRLDLHVRGGGRAGLGCFSSLAGWLLALGWGVGWLAVGACRDAAAGARWRRRQALLRAGAV